MIYGIFLLLAGMAAENAHGIDHAAPPPLVQEETMSETVNPELRAYIAEGLEKNPALEAMHATWLAALQVIPQARSLDDPMFRFGYFAKSMGKDYSLSLEQKFPWFGTLRLQGEEAHQEADAAWARLLATRNRIVLDIKRSYYDLLALEESLRILDAENLLQEELEKLARDRYSLGLEMQDDVLQMELEREKHHDQIASLNQMRPSLEAGLNEATGRALSAPVPTLQPLPLPVPPMATEDFAQKIASLHPEVQELDAMAEAAETGIKLAKKAGYPEITLEVMYESWRDSKSKAMPADAPGRIMAYRELGNMALGRMPLDVGDVALNLYDLNYRERMRNSDEWSVTAGFSLPIWRKRVRAGVEEARQELRSVELERTAALRQIEREAHQYLFQSQDAERQYRLVVDRLLPTAEQATGVVRERYASGDAFTMLSEVLMAARDEYMLQRMSVEVLRDWRTASAELEYTLGGAE